MDQDEKQDRALTPIAVFCGNYNCGCPTLALDPDAAPERQVVLTDDFGGRIEISREQLADLIEQARSGALDAALAHLPA